MRNLQDAFADAAARAAAAEAELGQVRRSAAAAAKAAANGSVPVDAATTGESRWRQAQAKQRSIVSRMHERIGDANKRGAALADPVGLVDEAERIENANTTNADADADASTPLPAVRAARFAERTGESPAVAEARTQARLALESVRDAAAALETVRSAYKTPSGRRAMAAAAARAAATTVEAGLFSPKENTPPTTRLKLATKTPGTTGAETRRALAPGSARVNRKMV